MRQTFYITIILYALSALSYGQDFKESFLKSFKTESRPTITLGTRNAFVTNEFAKMRHVFAGLNYKNVTRVGLSFNWLADGLKRPLDLNPEANLRMLYVSPHIEYVFYRTEHWELNIPVQLGMGMSYLQYDINNERIRTNKGFVMLYEPAMTVQYRFLKYLAVGGGAGLRVMLKNNKKIDDKFNSAVYIVWFKVFFGDLYKDYVKKGK